MANARNNKPEGTGLRGDRDVDQSDDFIRSIVIDTLSRAVQLMESRLPEFEGHSARVAGLSNSIGKTLGLSDHDVREMREAALVHDIGMLAIPDETLSRKGELAFDELARIHEHPRMGSSLVGRFPFLKNVARFIHFHHERWDGSGYPAGLSGSEIPVGARILGIAETYIALIEPRSYRDAMTASEAVQTISATAGIWFDGDTVGALVSAIAETTVGQYSASIHQETQLELAIVRALRQKGPLPAELIRDVLQRQGVLTSPSTRKALPDTLDSMVAEGVLTLAVDRTYSLASNLDAAL